MTAFPAHSLISADELRGEPGDLYQFENGTEVEVFARAKLPTRSGKFDIVAFRNNKDGKDHVALVRGDVVGREDVPLRIHSECLTGDVFASLKCDCREQLERAIDSVADLEHGIILYMRQEGRGIGLANKVKAYSLQDRGFDTVEANVHLGFDDDMREYDVSAAMVHLLGVRSVHLMTNNPTKLAGLEAHGVDVTQRSPIQIEPNPHNRFYLLTKREKSGHILNHLE